MLVTLIEKFTFVEGAPEVGDAVFVTLMPGARAVTSAVSESVTLSPAGGVPVAFTTSVMMPEAPESMCAIRVITVEAAEFKGPTLFHVIVFPTTLLGAGEVPAAT